MVTLAFAAAVASEIQLALTRHPEPKDIAQTLHIWNTYSHRVAWLLNTSSPPADRQLLAWRLTQVAALCSRFAVDLNLPEPAPDVRP